MHSIAFTYFKLNPNVYGTVHINRYTVTNQLFAKDCTQTRLMISNYYMKCLSVCWSRCLGVSIRPRESLSLCAVEITFFFCPMQDILAVGYGSFNTNDQIGIICCWSLKNPEVDQHVYVCDPACVVQLYAWRHCCCTSSCSLESRGYTMLNCLFIVYFSIQNEYFMLHVV